jgi:tetratricopeptide (TPR) repeat protein
MTPPPAPPPPPPAGAAEAPPRIAFAAFMLLLAATVAYVPSLTAPFIFDDLASIRDNPTLRSLWPPGPVLSPPHADGATVGGRPLLNLTLALNHAIGGTETCSYHVANLLIHIAAGLALLGILRRALAAAGVAGARREPVAFCTALLWTLHPLQTESVTYVVQRAESLAGLLYLLTLYAFLRSAATARPLGWQIASVAACLLGVATKEIVATAPAMVLLFDRALAAGSFRAALRTRAPYYAALAATWIVLGALVASTAGRGGTAGLGVGVTPWEYLLSQPLALARYLGLAAWPFPLVLDHGGTLAYGGAVEAAACAALALGLGAATVFAVARAPRAGLVGAWFFVTLAPSSSVVPLLDTMFAHRMYLALAAPLLLLALGTAHALGPRARPALLAAAAAAGLLTLARNILHRDDAALWAHNAAHTPGNARAHFQLAGVLAARGQSDAAIARYRTAIALRPAYIEARHNLGATLLRAGRVLDAIVELEGALRLHPRADTHFLLAGALAQIGRIDDALAQYDAALRLAPAHADALNNRGNLRLQKGAAPAALADYEAALRADPSQVDAHLNAAVALLALHRPAEAVAHCEAAVRLRPGYGAAHWKFGDTLLELNRPAAAVDRYREAVRLDPSLVHAHANLGRALAQAGRIPEALAAYEQALRLAPDWAQARHHYALALEAAGRDREAAAENAAALRLQPDFPEAATQRARLQGRAPRP